MAGILVVAPHAMDEVLGCGGTMARHADAGERIDTLVLCGDGSGLDATRRQVAPNAAAVLGANAPVFCGFPENRSDTIPLLDIVAAVERAIAAGRPHVVYVPHGGNLNIDHQTAFRAVLTAARPVPGHAVRAIYSYEVPSSTEWSSPSSTVPFQPSRFVDIGATIDRKMKALDYYRAELRDSPHARSRDGIAALAGLRGHQIGFSHAEAFGVVRQLIGNTVP